MKTIKLLFCFPLLVFICSVSYGQNWEWAKQGKGSLKSDTYGSPVAVDKNGNAYITGRFDDFVNFGTDTLIGAEYNAYVVKYDSLGNVIWVSAALDSANTDSWGESIAVDKWGNIYSCGSFSGTITFGTFVLRSPEEVSSYIVKYSSSGNVIWARQSIGKISSNCTSQSISLDKSSNIFITGYFSDTISFGSNILISTAYFYDVYIVKLDSLGNIIWAKQSITPLGYNGGRGTSLCCDHFGNIYVTGYFADTITFDTITLRTGSSASPFVAKYSPSGSLLWATKSNYSDYSLSNAIITDVSNSCYLTGYFENTLQFDSYTLFCPSSTCAFLAKYDSSGNIQWAKQSSLGWLGFALAKDDYNHIYFGGGAYSNPDTLVYNGYILRTNPLALSAAYLLKLDTAGNTLCGSLVNNLDYQWHNNCVASDSIGRYIYMASAFEDTIVCGADTLTSSDGAVDIFLGRWINSNSSISSISPISQSLSPVSSFPNPNNGEFTIQSSVVSSQASIEIYNVMGEKVYVATLKQVQGDNNINISSQPNGIYFYRVIEETGTLIGEGKVIISK